jgi:hypothetical protein
MTDEPFDAGPTNTVSSSRAEQDDDRVKIHIGTLSSGNYVIGCVTAEEVALVAAASIYSKAFLETLAKRHADGLADLVRTRIRKAKNAEAEIGLAGDAAAKIVVTEDTPDEARLVLLDLDVTDDAVRGKVLRWDSSASAWQPADDK